ncbi:MAG: transcriptional repressor [Candidatus Omnitrophica bacterium]|nr:transcriptional repressor [Candidatus Omnitrophota bacterium]
MEYKKILKRKKLKITPKRIAIINYFLKKDKYATPFDVWIYLKKNFKKIGLPTIYRNLEEFEKIGILTKIKGEENRFYYGICKMLNKKHHHHIICTSCHKISDFELCNFEQIKGEIEEMTNFEIKEHQFFLKGICKDCKEGGVNEKI